MGYGACPYCGCDWAECGKKCWGWRRVVRVKLVRV